MKIENLQPYQFQFETVDVSRVIDSNCNAITFVNKQTNPFAVTINGYVLGVGETLNLNGNTGEIDYTKYKIDFNFGGGFQIFVIRKINKYQNY